MGLNSMSIGSLVLILVIVMLLFGTKRIRDIGQDLGSALQSFRKGMQDVEKVSKDDGKPAVDIDNTKTADSTKAA